MVQGRHVEGDSARWSRVEGAGVAEGCLFVAIGSLSRWVEVQGSGCPEADFGVLTKWKVRLWSFGHRVNVGQSFQTD